MVPCTAAFVIMVVFFPTAFMRLYHGDEIRNPGSVHWGLSRRALQRRLHEAVAEGEAERFRSLRDSEVEAPLPRRTRFCRNAHELFPGRAYVDGDIARWCPDSCKIEHFTVKTTRKCLADRSHSIALYGDSLLNGIGLALAFKGNLSFMKHDEENIVPARAWRARNNHILKIPDSNNEVVQFYWSQAAHLMDPTDAVLRCNASNGLRSAGLVLLHHSIWDMGIACVGVVPFYRALKTRILKMKRAMRKGARLVVFDLHWLALGKCVEVFGSRGKCIVNNSGPRLAAFREAIRMAASCTGTEVFSDTELTRSFPSHTYDGIHYESPRDYHMQADLLLNAVCHRDGGSTPPLGFTPPAQCTETKTIAKWVSRGDVSYCMRDV